MGCVLEIILEVICEGLIEGYFYLMMLVAPEKTSNPKVRNTLKVIAGTMAGVLFVVLFLGLFALISDDAYTKTVGKYLVFIPLTIILIQMLLGIILRMIAKKKQ